MRIYLDDIRYPQNELMRVVRNFNQFCEAIDDAVQRGGHIDVISFDHDLGGIHDGVDCMNYLETRISDGGIKTIDQIRIHTANPPGRLRLQGLAKNIRKFYEMEFEIYSVMFEGL